jgi:hypothetical protein
MTTGFGLSGADLLLEAFERLQIRAAAITPDHVVSARRSMNLVQARWANRGTNLWKVDPTASPTSIALSQGTQTYALGASVIMVLDAYIRTVDQSGTPTDRILTPMSRSDYAATPNKMLEAPPTVYVFDRQAAAPTLTVWPVPDLSNIYTLRLYTVQQLQDANVLLAQSPDIPYRFSEALAADLAYALARKYPPNPASGVSVADLKLAAAEAWEEAAQEDRERVSLFMMPDLSGYFR